MDAVDIRALDHPAQLEQVVNLEIEVWGLSPRDAVPSNLLHVFAIRGGPVLGAFVWLERFQSGADRAGCSGRIWQLSILIIRVRVLDLR